LSVARTAGIGALEALGRTRLAVIAYVAHDDAAVRRLLEENVTFRLAGGEPLLGRDGELQLLSMQLAAGRDAEVVARIEELATRNRAHAHPHDSMVALTLLSRVHLAKGDVHRALTAAVDALAIGRQNIGRYFRPGHLGIPLEVLARVAVAAGDHARALRLESAAATFRERDAILRLANEQSELERDLAPARAALGEQASAEASTAGRALSVPAAIADALALELRGD
jgi:hypothetical protein